MSLMVVPNTHTNYVDNDTAQLLYLIQQVQCCKMPTSIAG